MLRGFNARFALTPMVKSFLTEIISNKLFVEVRDPARKFFIAGVQRHSNDF
jgi:hypothetical protein